MPERLDLAVGTATVAKVANCVVSRYWIELRMQFVDLIRQELHAGFAWGQAITDDDHIRGTFEEWVTDR